MFMLSISVFIAILEKASHFAANQSSVSFCLSYIEQFYGSASLANCFGSVDNISAMPAQLADFRFLDIEIRHGLLQVLINNDV
jgi:hypothetical protein